MSVQQPLSSTDFDVGWPFVVTPAKKWKLNTTSDAVAKKSDSFRSPIKLKLIPYNTAIAAIVNTNNDYESCNNHTATTATVATSVLSSDNGVPGRPPLPSRKNNNKVDHGWWTTTVDTESGGTDSIYINSNGYYNSLQEQPEKTNGFYSNNTINRHQRNRLDGSVVEQQRQEPLYRYSNTNNQPIAASLSNININNNCQGFSSGGSATLKNAASFGSRQNFGDNNKVVGLLTARKSCLTTTRSASKCNNNNNNDAASTSTLLLAKECTSTPTSAFIAAASCSSSSSSSHVAPTSLSNSNDNSNIGYCVTTNGNNAGSAIIPSKLRAAKSESCLKSSSTNGGDMSSSTTHNGSQASILLSDRDLDQVEMMYSSQGTKVFVCNCLANLYFNQINNNNNNNKTAGGYQTQWELIVTGIPVVVMNCGESRSRTTRQLSIVLAERGTGFTLWKEAITNYTNYEEIERTFHTLNSSTEAGRLAGLSFDNASSASKFHQHVKALFKETSSLNNNNNSNNQRNSTTNSSYSKQKSSSTATVSNEYLYAAKKQRRHSFVGGSKKVILRKAEISTPVCFKHITSVKPADLNPVILTGAGDSAVPKRAQSCVQILTIGDGGFKSIQ